MMISWRRLKTARAKIIRDGGLGIVTLSRKYILLSKRTWHNKRNSQMRSNCLAIIAIGVILAACHGSRRPVVAAPPVSAPVIVVVAVAAPIPVPSDIPA